MEDTDGNTTSVPNVLPTAIGGVQSVYANIGNQLINIVDNSKDFSQAINTVNNLDVSEGYKNNLKKELRAYYEMPASKGNSGGGR